MNDAEQRGCGSMNDAEQNCLAIMEEGKVLTQYYVRLATLLWQNFTMGWFKQASTMDFGDFIREAKIPFVNSKDAGKLCKLVEAMAEGSLSDDDVIGMGIQRAILLLQAEDITEDLIEQAKHAPEQDFKEILGIKRKNSPTKHAIHCDKCGTNIPYVEGMEKWRR